MRNYSKLTIRFAQDNQPWTVPYSANFMSAARGYTGPNGRYQMPHLFGAHTVLHAQKTLGQIAAVFEALDHSGVEISEAQIAVIADKSADLVTAALRFANLYGFDLAQSLVERCEEKNSVVLPSWE